MTDELLETAERLADEIEYYLAGGDILSLPPTRAEYEAGPAGDADYESAVQDHHENCDAAAKDAVALALHNYRRAQERDLSERAIRATSVIHTTNQQEGKLNGRVHKRAHRTARSAGR
jgi:hypothetical protein